MALVSGAAADPLELGMQMLDFAQRRALDEGEMTTLKLKGFMETIQGNLDALAQENQGLRDQLEGAVHAEREIEVLQQGELEAARMRRDAARAALAAAVQERDATAQRAGERIAAAIAVRSAAVLAAERTTSQNVAALERELEEARRALDAVRPDAAEEQRRIQTERTAALQAAIGAAAAKRTALLPEVERLRLEKHYESGELPRPRPTSIFDKGQGKDGCTIS